MGEDFYYIIEKGIQLLEKLCIILPIKEDLQLLLQFF